MAQHEGIHATAMSDPVVVPGRHVGRAAHLTGLTDQGPYTARLLALLLQRLMDVRLRAVQGKRNNTPALTGNLQVLLRIERQVERHLQAELALILKAFLRDNDGFELGYVYVIRQPSPHQFTAKQVYFIQYTIKYDNRHHIIAV